MEIKELPGIEAIVRDKDTPMFVVLRHSTYRNFINKLAFSGTIDEADYLKRHSDVAKAIAEGKVESAREHYLRSGYFEGRKAKILSADLESESDTEWLSESMMPTATPLQK